jgi:hypothetical protein
MSTDTPKPNAIERLVIESEVRRLLAAYVHNLDDAKTAENADLLAHTQFKVIDTVVTGRDEIEQFLKKNIQYHEDGTPRTWHSLSNILIEIDSATTAKSVCYFTVHQQTTDLPLQPIVTGRYIDTFELRDGAWRFATREIQPHLFGDVSHHVAAAAEATVD